MTAAERFGRNLFMARRRAGLSQYELAMRADLHWTAISMIERGLRAPRLETTLSLLRGLEVEPGVLFKGLV